MGCIDLSKLGGIVKVKNMKHTQMEYECPKLSLIVIQNDIVTFSNGNNENFGSDLGDGQIGGEDIFN